jgi:pyruvate/2-oxoglutarate dehydrogenase complex dihydrolipoamide dehydrogenase (E3) component
MHMTHHAAVMTQLTPIWLALAEGRGKVIDAHTVEVELSSGDKRMLRTKYILIATGGKPVKAPIPGSVR